MKILSKSINAKTTTGSVRVEPEEEDDMYHLHNIISFGDIVEASTIRNVVKESKSGARNKERVLTKISIRVENIEFDAGECSLRLKGRNVKENEHLKMGQYHTLELELHRPCTIQKDSVKQSYTGDNDNSNIGGWDALYLNILDDASDLTRNADVAVIVMQEGLANVCLIKRAITKVCAKIECTLPRKKSSTSGSSNNRASSKGNSNYDRALLRFFDDIYSSIKNHFNFEIVKAVVVGSPGFLNQDFYAFMLEKAVKLEDMVIMKNKQKFIMVHASSGYKRAIEEMLSSSELVARIGEVRAAAEIKALNHFYEVLSADPDRACYGYQQVVAAHEHQAISELLVTESFIRANGDHLLRNSYVSLINSVEENGGKVYKFSELHVSGEQLNMYTGVAATLRFPVPDIDTASNCNDSTDSDKPDLNLELADEMHDSFL